MNKATQEMAKSEFTEQEIEATQTIINSLNAKDTSQAIQRLLALKDEVYATIPDKQRQSRGITWVLEHISQIFVQLCGTGPELKEVAEQLYENMEKDDRLQGIPIFMMAEYGTTYPEEVLGFFIDVANSDDSIVREFAQGGFRKLIKPHQELILPWLKELATNDSQNLRRFVSETLRPVCQNRWLKTSPESSLEILRLLFKEPHPYPRTSVGNNLSDLSKSNPELIFGVIQDLVAMQDKNSDWIAYRACRNLVKKEPLRVLDTLGIDEYHYKDRNFYRTEEETS